MNSNVNAEVISLRDVPDDESDVSYRRQQPVVLVVDDERVIADTLSTILRKSGFATRTAYDASSALEIAKEVSPALLISDVVMPGMSGVELAITLTHDQPECKVLLFSGQAATVDLLAEAREAGHNFTTLTKPVHPTDMLRHISECLVGSGAVFEAVMKSQGGGFVSLY